MDISLAKIPATKVMVIHEISGKDLKWKTPGRNRNICERIKARIIKKDVKLQFLFWEDNKFSKFAKYLNTSSSQNIANCVIGEKIWH